MRRHVIIGNSGAAISAVRAIRSLRPHDDITLVSRENCFAYSPVLTPYYIAGRIPYEGMFFCGEAFYKENRVRTILGHPATRVDPASRSVFLDDGKCVPYDNLLVATGSSSVPAMGRARRPKVFTLWTAEDAKRIKEALEGVERVVVVGGGLIGVQILGAMISLGKKVSLVERMRQTMPLVLDEASANILHQRMRRSRVDLRLNSTVRAISEEAGRIVVALASGSEIEAHMVIFATGIKPNVELIRGSGIGVATGVLVDEYGRTNVEGIFAAGDVAEAVDPITGRSRIVATWLNAVEQGRITGLNMCGRKVPHLKRVAVNIFTALGLPFATIGLARGGKSYEEVSRRDGEVYRKLVFEGDRLVGAVLVGVIDEAGILAGLIECRRPYPHLREELMRDRAFVCHARALSGQIHP